MGVVKLPVPVAKAVPPVEAAYQSIFAPELALAVSVVVPVVQIVEPFDDDATVGNGFIVAVIIDLAALLFAPATQLDELPVKAKLDNGALLLLPELSVNVLIAGDELLPPATP